MFNPNNHFKQINTVLLLSLILFSCIRVLKVNAVPTNVIPNDKIEQAFENDSMIDAILREEITRSLEPNSENITDTESDNISWIPILSKAPRPPSVEIIESSENYLVLNLTIYGMYHTQKYNGSSLFDQITIPETGLFSEIGKAQIPAIREYIKIPRETSVSLDILYSTQYNISNYKIWPSQSPIPEVQEKTRKQKFEYDEQFYCQSNIFPSDISQISSPMFLRNHELIQLCYYPIQIYPFEEIIQITSNIIVKINFNTKITSHLSLVEGPRVSDKRSQIFDNLITELVLNEAPKKYMIESVEETGYLIVTHDSFFDSLNEFILWKQDQGLSVSAVKLSEIGINPTDEDIYSFIKNAYETWQIPPTYILLVGDVEYVPTHYGIFHMYHNETTPTDHYYACVAGDDYFPDLLVGRLSVKNLNELSSILDKIINYSGGFTKKITLIADNEEGRTFEETSNWVYDYTGYYGYTADRFHESTNTATISNIQTAINEGRSIVNYRGHGNPTSWHTSGFSNEDILTLNNQNKYPFVVSCTCLTGYFDYHIDSFGETWMKAPNKGAVAFWGSSRVSYSGWNDDLVKNVYISIFEKGATRVGFITTLAKLDMFRNYGDGYLTELEFELYNLLSDPHLEIFPTYTHELEINLNHQEHVDNGELVRINASVSNIGQSIETDISVELYINNELVENARIDFLNPNDSQIIQFQWQSIPGLHNITVILIPVSDESLIYNNRETGSLMVYDPSLILIVNDNTGNVGFRGSSLTNITNILDESEYTYIKWDKSQDGVPELYVMNLFDTLIWTTGDYYSWAVDPYDALLLDGYVRQGGNLILEGQDIGYDHKTDSFMVNVAHASFQKDKIPSPGLRSSKTPHSLTEGIRPDCDGWIFNEPERPAGKRSAGKILESIRNNPIFLTKNRFFFKIAAFLKR